jgi:DNA-binding MarR family transcriptional regulator
MKLEDEIKQKKFKTEYEKAVVNIAVTFNWSNIMVSRLMKEFGLTPQQFNVLRILKGQYPNPATVNLIGSRMLDKMSNASRIVDKLFAKGYVERKSCPNDRRAVDIILTEKGSKLLGDVNIRLYELFDEKSKALTTEETQQLNFLLDKLRS